MITSKACPYWTIKYLQWEKLSSKIGWTWTVLQNRMDIAFQGGTCANIQRVVCSYPESLLMYVSCSLHYMRTQITASVTWAHPRGLKCQWFRYLGFRWKTSYLFLESLSQSMFSLALLLWPLSLKQLDIQ